MCADGSLHEGHVNKHHLIDELTKGYTINVVTSQPSALRKVVIIDAMVIVQKIANAKKNLKEIETCEDLSKLFIESIKNCAQGFDEARVVLDDYYDISLKNHTRQKRGNINTTNRFLIEDRTLIRDGPKQFLSNLHTKRDLTVYLAAKCHIFFKNSNMPYIVSANAITSGNIGSDIKHNHEEADTNIIWHCIHTSSTGTERDTAITVISSDTDVLCLLIRFHHQMFQKTYMKTTNHLIHICSIVNMLRPNKALALTSLHALSGCDTTGRFLKKGKLKWLDAFLKSDESMDIALQSLETADLLYSISKLEELVCRLYCNASHIKTLKDARYYLYCLDTARCERLPPTTASFTQAVLRAAYHARVWSLSDKDFRELPDPEKHGWTFVDGNYVGIPYEGKIAPDTIFNLVKCGCLKTNCKTGRCKCCVTTISCTDLCQCSDKCENSDPGHFLMENDISDDDIFNNMKV